MQVEERDDKHLERPISRSGLWWADDGNEFVSGLYGCVSVNDKELTMVQLTQDVHS
jgi:hypothetical protein